MSSAGRACHQSATGRPARIAPGSAAAHGTRTKARSRRARVRQGQLGVVADHVVDGDHVDVERARPPAHVAGAPGRLLGGVRPVEPVARSAAASRPAGPR